jgi:uncharacterized protein YaiL (DUF2058 family)
VKARLPDSPARYKCIKCSLHQYLSERKMSNSILKFEEKLRMTNNTSRKQAIEAKNIEILDASDKFGRFKNNKVKGITVSSEMQETTTEKEKNAFGNFA